MSNSMTINFNNKNYIANYNNQTGYWEVELEASEIGGIYNANIEYTDFFGQTYDDTQKIQILAEEKIKIENNIVLTWIFDYRDFSLKDILETSDYEINIDEETNANSSIKVLKKTKARANDIVVIKKNNEEIYWGKIEEITNEDGKIVYTYSFKYITNIFNQNVILKNEELIKTTGIEDFIAETIKDNFIESEDTFLNKTYLEVIVKTHTKKQTTVDNVQDGIFNLHTFMTNCTQSYNLRYDFAIVNKKLVLTIENKELEKELIDTTAQPISNYTEVYETNVVAKVTVLTKEEGEYNLYLLNDRTTTTDKNNENRAEGKTEVVYTEKMEEANQKALDTMKANSYNHNITFKYYDRYIKIGTPIAIRTKDSKILDTYISAIKITQNKFIEYTCGNIRIDFISKIKKERK